MGVTGIHPAEGLTTGDVEEAAVKRALMSRAAETIVMASSEKLGAVSPYLVAPIAEISGIDRRKECAGRYRLGDRAAEA